MANNIETVRAWTAAYNSRNWYKWLSVFSPDVEFVDLSMGVTMKGRDELLAYGKGWDAGFSDIAYTDMRLVQAGDGLVLFQFTAAGTNDGAYGALPATGKAVSVPVINVVQFGRDGEVTRVEQLYDRLSILIQLGHAAQ